jgi:hypothetical protein
MQEAITRHRNLAQSLLALEGSDLLDGASILPAAERVLGKLCQHLTRLVGVAGCTALLRRAIHLAAVDFPFLDAVAIGPNAEVSLVGMRERLQGDSAQEARDGLVAVTTCLLWLLATFIGEILVLHLLRQIWPDLPPVDGGIERGRQ